MKRNELMKKVYASPVISEEIVAVESGFAASGETPRREDIAFFDAMWRVARRLKAGKDRNV